MSELEFKYNYKKIVLYIFITIILTILFTYLFLEANELVLRTPKGGKYSWVGHIFYQNEKLLSIVSFCFVLLFIFFLFFLVNLLIKKKLVIRNEFNILFINNEKIVNISNIKNVDFIKVNKSAFIYIYFKDPQNRKIEKYLPLVFKKYSKKSKYFLNLTFLKDNPNEVYLSFKKVIK